MTSPSQRHWWKRKRWRLAVAALLLAAYPASAGPVVYLWWRWRLPPTVLLPYAPVRWLDEAPLVGPPYQRYLKWFEKRGLGDSGWELIEDSDGHLLRRTASD